MFLFNGPVQAVGNSQNTLHIGASAVDTDSSAVEMQAVSIPETDHKAVSSNASSISAAEPIIELRRHEQVCCVFEICTTCSVLIVGMPFDCNRIG